MWPCESSHRIVVSLNKVDQITITLPHPIVSDTIESAVGLKDGIVEIYARKALNNDLWPEDVLMEQFRWKPDSFAPWDDHNALAYIHLRENLQTQLDLAVKEDTNKIGAIHRGNVALSQVREIIRTIFVQATQNGQLRFQLQMKTSSAKRNDAKVFCYIRAHPPVRVSSRGSPILFLSVTNQQSKSEFRRLFPDAGANASISVILANSSEVALLFLQILRVNSAKIQPTPWQKENLPLEGESGSAWMATFIRLLYVDGFLNGEILQPLPLPATKGRCAKCRAFADNLKFCARCVAETYCSAECQRSHWKTHKPSCIEAAGKWKDETMPLVMGPELPAEPSPPSPSSESVDMAPDWDIRDNPRKVKTRKNAEPKVQCVSIFAL